jgi:hypothetical protein
MMSPDDMSEDYHFLDQDALNFLATELMNRIS